MSKTVDAGNGGQKETSVVDEDQQASRDTNNMFVELANGEPIESNSFKWLNDAMARIIAVKRVAGIFVVRGDCTPVYSTFDHSTTTEYAQQATDLFSLSALLVRESKPDDKLLVIRLRTKKTEILISPMSRDKPDPIDDSWICVVQHIAHGKNFAT
ncbi:hypothetical protein SNEBB_004640 [Seison nebaliae]|nr:hypothetical protein SNEBB_004640 [Seison nebaliae]